MTERAQALEAALRAVADEDELDGPIPTHMREAFNLSPEESMRATVRATKAGIAARIGALLAVPPPPPVGSPTTEARTMTVAREIAKHLMTNTLGERCDRLAQLHQGFPIGGGWSFEGAAEQIAEVLETEGYIMDRVAEAQKRAAR